MSQETRICRKCGQEKDTEEFKESRSGNGRRYRMRSCKECNYTAPPPRKSVTYANKSMYCIEDPTGMYTDGHIVKGQFNITLAAGLLPPVSVWVDKSTGQEYIVKGNEHWHDILDCVKNPDKEYLKSVFEKQRLVRI